MSAHHIKHASACPALGNKQLRRCTCGAPGAAAAQGTPCDVCLAGPGVPCLVEMHERADRHPSGAPPATVARYLRDGDATQLASADLTRLAEREEGERSMLDRLARDQAAAERIEQPRGVVAGLARAFAQEGAEASAGETIADDAFELTQQISMLLERHVTVTFANGGQICARQRCGACRTEIRTFVQPGELRGMDGIIDRFAAVGSTARKAYLKHACAPVERSLLGLTYPELEALHAELEHESTRMMGRADAIARLMRQGS